MGEIHNLADTGLASPGVDAPTLDWTDPRLVRITRIRFLGDSWAGPFDLSYAWGVDAAGTPVRVRIPTYQVRGPGRTILAALVRDARRDRLFLKELCGGDINDVLSVMW